MDTITITLRGNIANEIQDFVQEYHNYVHNIDIKYSLFVSNEPFNIPEVKLSKTIAPTIELVISPVIYETFLIYLDFLQIKYGKEITYYSNSPI